MWSARKNGVETEVITWERNTSLVELKVVFFFFSCLGEQRGRDMFQLVEFRFDEIGMWGMKA